MSGRAIAGSGTIGVTLDIGGTWTNNPIQTSPSVLAPAGLVQTLFNYGVISATGAGDVGVALRGADTLVNGGVIRVDGSASTGVYLQSVNATLTAVAGGTIAASGAYAAAVAFGAGGGRAVIDPGAVLSGGVYDRYGAGTLELTAGTQSGTLNGELSQYSGLGSVGLVILDAGANWTLTGITTKHLVDDGTLTTDALLSTGPVVIGAGGNLTVPLGGSIDPGTGITFATNSGVLSIPAASGPDVTLFGFTPGDAVVLEGLTYASGASATVGANGMLTVASGGSTASLWLNGNFGGQQFALLADGTAATELFLTTSGPNTLSGTISQISTLSPGEIILAPGALLESTAQGPIGGSGVTLINHGTITGPATAPVLSLSASTIFNESDGNVTGGLIVPSLANYGTITAQGTSAVGTLTNAGVILVNGANFAVSGPLSAPASGSGLIEVGAGGSLFLGGSVASRETIAFAGSGGANPVVALANVSGFSGTISNVIPGATLDLVGIFLPPTGTDSGSAVLSLLQRYRSVQFPLANLLASTPTVVLSADGAGGTDIAFTQSIGSAPTPAPPNTIATGTNTGTDPPPPLNQNGTVSIAAGGTLSSGSTNATFTTPVALAGAATFSATPGTTLSVLGQVMGGSTISLSGDVVMPSIAFSGTVVAAGSADTIGAITTNVEVVAGAATTLTFLGSAGASTVFGGGGGGLIEGGSGGRNVLVATGGATTVLGSAGGADTLVAGGAAQSTMLAATPDDLVFAAAGNCTVFGAASGTDTLVGGNSGAATLVGSTGDDAMWGGLGQDILFGGSGRETLGGGAGNTTVVAGGGSSTLVGGSGDQVFVGAASGQATAFSGTGNSTLFTGGEAMLAILQNPLLATDTVVLQSGAATIWGGTGADVYAVINGAAGGKDLIAGFKPGVDSLNLFGYAPNSAVVTGSAGATSLKLSDGTTITFAGLSPAQVLPNIHYG